MLDFWNACKSMLDDAVPQKNLPLSIIYNEGWLLRFVLFAEASGIHCLPFRFAANAQWFSEGQLQTPFRSRKRGDRIGESRTSSDAVVGHFDLQERTTAGITLRTDTQQFIVIEAKILSGFGNGTINYPDYDQLSRTLTCMTYSAVRANLQEKDALEMVLYVFAPHAKLTGQLNRHLEISQKMTSVRKRFESYELQLRNAKDIDAESAIRELTTWWEYFEKQVGSGKLRIVPYSWESIIETLAGVDSKSSASIGKFYDQCLHAARRQDHRR